MALYFENARDRIAFTTKGLKTTYDGSKGTFLDFTFHVSTHVTSCGWDSTICLLQTSEDTNVKIHETPNLVTLEMLSEARMHRLSNAENAIDEAEIESTKLLVSSSAELNKFLVESTTGSALKIFLRYAKDIKGDGPTALWYLFTKLRPSALWGQEAARAAINSAKLSQFGGDVLAYLSHIDEHVKSIQQYSRDEDDDWLCGALLKGLSDSTNVSWTAVMTTLKMQRKQDPISRDSSWIIDSADDWYRDIQAEHGFDHANANETVESHGTINALMSSASDVQLQKLISLNENLLEILGDSQKDSSSDSTYPGWNTDPLKPGKPSTKELKGRTFRWCEFCRYWGLHKPGNGPKCTKNRDKPDSDTTNPSAHLSFCLDGLGSAFLTRASISNNRNSRINNLTCNWEMPKLFIDATRVLVASSHQLPNPTEFSDIILIDSCATLHITSNLNDLFNFKRAERPVVLQGIANGLQLLGFGDMRLNYLDNDRQRRFLILRKVGLVSTPAGYPPLRLLSPQTLCRDKSSGVPLNAFTTKDESSELKFMDHSVLIPYNASNNLPTFMVSIETPSNPSAFCSISHRQMNSNLYPMQQVLLQYHKRLGHIDMSMIQDLSRASLLPKGLASCKIPKCRECIFGKQTRNAKGSSTTLHGKMRPGDAVHCDQLISGHSGKQIDSNSSNNITVVNVFVDACSRLPKSYFSDTTSAEAAVLAKMKFERFAAEHSVRIRHYHADNGVYKSNLWMKHCEARGQTSSFCGVSAHQQNPVAENLNRRATEMARTLLLTAQLCWNDLAAMGNFDLRDYWTFALEYSFELLSRIPLRSQQYSPIDVFTGQKMNTNLNDFHTWGCPAYVLDPRLAGGKKIPRWLPRSKRGLYLGRSRMHASTVALILNLTTKRISPQFHVVFDDDFTTVGPNSSELVKEWQHLVNYKREIYTDHHDERSLQELPYTWTDHTDNLKQSSRMQEGIPSPIMNEGRSSTTDQASEIISIGKIWKPMKLISLLLPILRNKRFPEMSTSPLPMHRRIQFLIKS